MKKTSLLLGLCSLLLLSFIGGCGKKEQSDAGYPAVAVHMGQAVKKDIPVAIPAVGSVEAYRSVTVIPQVTGQIMDINFREGQDVKKGDILFTIDPATYREELRKAQAMLVKDQAQLDNYNAEAERYDFLMKKGAVAKSEYEKFKTNAAVQQAILNNSKAAVEDASLKLSYCSIRAPLDGRAGAFQVNKGAVVSANSTALVSLNQMSPVYVKFSVPEKLLPEIKKYNAVSPLIVKAGVAGLKEASRQGRLEFIDNTVDPDTGVIKLKALFANADRFLWPGQFVNVGLWLRVQEAATVVPAAAVQLAQESKYVFIVRADKTVHRQVVEVDRIYGNEAVINAGVQAGDIVVTDGHFKLKEGFKVVEAELSKGKKTD